MSKILNLNGIFFLFKIDIILYVEYVELIKGTNEKNVYELLSPKYFSNKYKKDDFSVPLLYSESSFDNNLFSIPFK